MSTKFIGIAGAGRIGCALGRLLRERGQPVAAVAGRDSDRTAAAAAFIGGVEPVSYAQLPRHAARLIVAVPDDALEPVAALLAESAAPGGLALHTCGLRGPEALAALEARGVSCAALHPLQTVATPEQGLSALAGAVFGLTGSGPAAEWALEIVRLLEGRALEIPAGKRPLYHAAAVMAGNYAAALIDAAVILMGEAGVDREQALEALGPLIRTSVENALALGPLAALTGPIERGDINTVRAHLQALADAPETVRGLYRSAGLHTIEMSRRKTPGADRREMERGLREGQP